MSNEHATSAIAATEEGRYRRAPKGAAWSLPDLNVLRTTSSITARTVDEPTDSDPDREDVREDQGRSPGTPALTTPLSSPPIRH